MKIHSSITPEILEDAVKRQMFDLDNPGFCVSCGDEASGCEPDARKYECESCGEASVYGAEELFMMLA